MYSVWHFKFAKRTKFETLYYRQFKVYLRGIFGMFIFTISNSIVFSHDIMNDNINIGSGRWQISDEMCRCVVLGWGQQLWAVQCRQINIGPGRWQQFRTIQCQFTYNSAGSLVNGSEDYMLYGKRRRFLYLCNKLFF
jgi:hypothetical protein